MLRSSFHSAIISFLGRMLTIPKNQGRGKEVPEPRPLQRLRRRKIPLITKPLCQPQNQGQKSNQRSKKPLQRKKNMSTLYSSVMSVSSICFCYVFWPRVLNLAVITERMENEIKKKEFYENYTSLIDFFVEFMTKRNYVTITFMFKTISRMAFAVMNF